MARHWVLLTVLGFLTAGVVFVALWWAYGRILLLRRPSGGNLRSKLTFWRRRDRNEYELLQPTKQV